MNTRAICVIFLAILASATCEWLTQASCEPYYPYPFPLVFGRNGNCVPVQGSLWRQITCSQYEADEYICADPLCNNNCKLEKKYQLYNCVKGYTYECAADQPNYATHLGEKYVVIGSFPTENCTSPTVTFTMAQQRGKCLSYGQGQNQMISCADSKLVSNWYTNSDCSGQPYHTTTAPLNTCYDNNFIECI